ncbi:flagellin N-terminal helical domain-containing protein [Priestia aryabhattai]|uniref:flagellin N-terminal helical domain-containing protein n=1 Tax=Priestia aryabhattai TaxID=412384 RepID=UPI0029584433|nr:flagellin [Priestia aryabhattai]
MRINHNITALNTYGKLNSANNAQAKSMEKLSSGLRINSAADDAAGLAISEKMRGQIRGLDQASRNAQDGISLIQTAEGALTETQSMVQRMRELAVQASSDTYTNEDRKQIDSEFQQLKTEITDTASQTKFNKMTLLDGTFGNAVSTDPSTSTALAVAGVTSISGSGATGTYTITDDGTDFTITDGDGNSETIAGGTMKDGAQTLKIDKFDITIQTDSSFVAASLDTEAIVVEGNGSVTFQTGANNGDTMSLSIGDMSASGLGINNDDLTTRDNANTAITNLESALKKVSDERSNLGSKQNRLEHRVNNLSTSSENLTAAESRIRDVDYALAA